MGDYAVSMYLDSDVSDITLLNREGAVNKVQYYHITSGVTGELILEAGRNYKTTIAKNSNGEIVQFNIADLV